MSKKGLVSLGDTRKADPIVLEGYNEERNVVYCRESELAGQLLLKSQTFLKYPAEHVKEIYGLSYPEYTFLKTLAYVNIVLSACGWS